MRLPTMHGIIRRRLLVNFRVDPDVIRRVLPARFRPKLQGGWAVAGICLIRLEEIRPQGVPRILGIASENAAHRIAVEWDDGEGVFIPRRDTSSRINRIAGGRLFPGEHNAADFDVKEHGERIELTMQSTDKKVRVEVDGRTGAPLQSTIFNSIDEASNFFKGGSLGYSATRDANRLDGVMLHTPQWSVAPLGVDHVYSSWFDDRAVFPEGSAAFDCALIMRNVAHEWHSRNSFFLR